MNKIIALLDKLIHEKNINAEDESILIRSRILVGINIMYFSSLFFLVCLLLTLSLLKIMVLWAPFTSCALSSSCYLFQIFYFKKTGNIVLSASITMLILLTFTVVFTYFTGGWNSPVLLFLFVVPMCAFLITGHSHGVFWSVLVIVVYAALGGLEYFNIKTPQLIPVSAIEIIKFFSWVFSWIMIVCGVTLYSAMANMLNASINNEKEKIRFKATYDEESGVYTREAFKQILPGKIKSLSFNASSFALAFVEVELPAGISDPGIHALLLKSLAAFISERLGHNVILSRYSQLSLTLLILNQQSNNQACKTLENLYKDMQPLVAKLTDDQSSNGVPVSLHLGAVTVFGGFVDDANTLTDDARNALLNAKHQNKPVIHRRGERKTSERYITNITTTSFDQLVNKHS